MVEPPVLLRRLTLTPIARHPHLIDIVSDLDQVAMVEPSVRQPGERKLLSARLLRSIFLSDQTKHLEFAVEGVDKFNFIPGQFVSIQQPKPDGKTHTRAYSLASTPRMGAKFDLCLNRVEQGFLSNWLCDLEEGT
ncbi:MAG TPA: FAD-binding oxidoreductase, partial [Terriglobales bacterium]